MAGSNAGTAFERGCGLALRFHWEMDDQLQKLWQSEVAYFQTKPWDPYIYIYIHIYIYIYTYIFIYYTYIYIYVCIIISLYHNIYTYIIISLYHNIYIHTLRAIMGIFADQSIKVGSIHVPLLNIIQNRCFSTGDLHIFQGPFLRCEKYEGAGLIIFKFPG